MPSEQQRLNIDERTKARQYQLRPRQTGDQLSSRYRELSEADSDDASRSYDEQSDDEYGNASGPAHTTHSNTKHINQPALPNAAAAATTPGTSVDTPALHHSGGRLKRLASASGFDDVRSKRQSRTAPYNTLLQRSPLPTNQQMNAGAASIAPSSAPQAVVARPVADVMPSGSAFATPGLQQFTHVHAAMPISLTPAAAAPADLVGAPHRDSLMAAAAAHAHELMAKAQDRVKETQIELNTWKQAITQSLTTGPLPRCLAESFQSGLSEREQALTKAQVTVSVHEEWSAYLLAALERGRLP